MRAKRSKKYRKLMHQYELAFGFREPFQVLVDSHFLKAVHAFKMDFVPALERTLQGKVKPFITKCSMNALTSAAAQNPSPAGADSRTHSSRQNFRPAELPPPTVLPLRYCKHNEEETPIDETECLISLLAPKKDEQGLEKNKEHYILATGEPPAPKQENKAKPDRRKEAEFIKLQREASELRWRARQIPGVPIIYVKRSVMILEPMSGGSERIREGFERGKFKTGLKAQETPDIAAGKRKRDDADIEEKVPLPKKALKKAKGPNPLSVKKPKKEKEQATKKKDKRDVKPSGEETSTTLGDSTQSGEKSKRKRRHKKRQGEDGEGATATVGADDAMDTSAVA